MEIARTDLPDVLVITPRKFEDARGWFSEVYNRETFAQQGIDLQFVQDNHSSSGPRNTLRGLHCQAPPRAQDKLVRVARGAIWDVAVDIRNGSGSYGRWTGVRLSAENGKQLLVPAGFLHGFVTLEADTEVIYKCSDTYAPEFDHSVRWDSCGIDWPFDGEPVLSDKDADAPAFDDFCSPFDDMDTTS